MNEILAFSLISLLLVLSPGPNSILILKSVSSQGKRAGMENIVGLVIATFLHGAVSLLGLSALILQSAELFVIVKLLGAAYLLYLGLKTLLASFQQHKELTENSAGQSSLAQKNSQNSTRKNMLEGFLTQLLNPKVSVFYLAAFPQFLNFETASMLDAFLLVSIHAAMIAMWFIVCSFVIDHLKQAVSEGAPLRQKAGRWVQRFSGGFLVYFSVLLVTQEGAK